MNFNQQEFNNFVLDNDIIGFFAEPITLKSGRISNWYVNWRNPTTDALLLEKLAQFVIAFVKDNNLNPNCFYGVPEGATKLGVITQYLWAKETGNKIMSMGRAKPKEHGAAKDKFFVGMPEGKTIVVEDVTTTGGSLLETIQNLKEAGIDVIAAVGLTNRNEKRDDGRTVKQAVEDLGVDYHALSNAAELLPELAERIKPEEGVLKAIEEYFERYSDRKLKFLTNETTPTIQLTEQEQLARKRVCLPLDGLQTLEEVKQRVEELAPVVGLFKVGKESYTRFGQEVIKLVQSYGANIFLDLKYHDIPNTVKGAAKAAAELGVYMFNVHASGGLEMMKAALEGAKEGALNSGNSMPKVIGVTVLTSIDQEILNRDLRVPGEMSNQILHLAKLTQQAGLDGVVCSAADLAAIKNELPENFMFVTPGIKGPNTPAGYDQKRVFTPGNAIEDGSTILVIGRAITNAEDRVKAGKEVLMDIVGRM